MRNDPAAWRSAGDPVPGLEHAFEVRRGDQKVHLTTTLKQRPLWRFFPAGGDEWVLWMWRNYYYDSSTKGDNASAGTSTPSTRRTRRPSTARSSSASYFRRPDVINKLLKSRDPAEALSFWATTCRRCISTAWSRRPRAETGRPARARTWRRPVGLGPRRQSRPGPRGGRAVDQRLPAAFAPKRRAKVGEERPTLHARR